MRYAHLALDNLKKLSLGGHLLSADSWVYEMDYYLQ